MEREPSGWAIGYTVFAALMMLMLGVWWIIAGLAAIIDDEFFVVAGDWILKFDATAWGWIHLILGIVVLIASFGLYTGSVWGRTVGVILAVLSAVAAFGWLPYYPIWGILIIALAVAVIWALTAHGRDITEA